MYSGGDVLVEEITHAVDEDPARLPPLQRQFQLIGVQREIEAVLVSRIAHCLQTGSEALGVAILTARADLRASRDGIPCCIRPFDCGFIAH